MDKIKEQFLARVWEAAEDVYRKQTALLKQQEEALEDDTAGGMSARMGELAALYGTLQEKQPRYMVISYMRSSLADGYPWYRLNLYDEDYFDSDGECGVWLEVPALAQCLGRIMDMVGEEFRKQTRVEEYYMDPVLKAYGEKLHGWMLEHIYEITRKHLLMDHWERFYSKNRMNILIGDYRNHATRVFGWGLDEGGGD